MAFEFVLEYLDFFVSLAYFSTLILSGIVWYIILQFLGADDWVRELLFEFYRGVRGLYVWFIQTFHFNRPEEILALTLLYFVCMIIFIYNIGGEGIAGVKTDPNAEGLFGLSLDGVTIGSNLVVLGVDAGLAEIRKETLTTITIEEPFINITPNVTTTITTDLTCESNADCGILLPPSSGFGVPYCCPPDTGECAGYCYEDCYILGTEYVTGYDYHFNPPKPLGYGIVAGTEDYSLCRAACLASSCKTSWVTVRLILPENDSVESNATMILDWV